MRLTTEQSYALLEKRGCYASQACDKCGQILGPVRFARRNDSGAWCSRDCRDGAAAHAPGTCKTCKAQLPEGKRRGAMYCDDACKQAAYRSKADARLSETPKLSVTKASIYAAFSSRNSAVRGARLSSVGSCAQDDCICRRKRMSGRKPKTESRADEFRQRLVIWKHTPEFSRPSLRELARQLGTSHQMLNHLLKGLDKWQAQEDWRRVKEIRGRARDENPFTDTLGRAAIARPGPSSHMPLHRGIP